MAKSHRYSPEYYPPVNFHFAVHFGASSNIDLKKNNFKLTGEGISFQSVSGLSVQIQTENIKEGGENRFEHVEILRPRPETRPGVRQLQCARLAQKCL
jgi:T4-like virus tail tube protein gp19